MRVCQIQCYLPTKSIYLLYCKNIYTLYTFLGMEYSCPVHKSIVTLKISWKLISADHALRKENGKEKQVKHKRSSIKEYLDNPWINPVRLDIKSLACLLSSLVVQSWQFKLFSQQLWYPLNQKIFLFCLFASWSEEMCPQTQICTASGAENWTDPIRSELLAFWLWKQNFT